MYCQYVYEIMCQCEMKIVFTKTQKQLLECAQGINGDSVLLSLLFFWEYQYAASRTCAGVLEVIHFFNNK